MNITFKYAALQKIVLIVALLVVTILICTAASQLNPAHTEAVHPLRTGNPDPWRVSYNNSLFIWPDQPGFLHMSATARARAIIIP